MKDFFFLLIIFFPSYLFCSLSFDSIELSTSSQNSLFQNKVLWFDHTNIYINYDYSIFTYTFDSSLYQMAFNKWSSFNKNTFSFNPHFFWSIIFGTFISNNQSTSDWYDTYQLFFGIKYNRKYFSILWSLSSNLSSQVILKSQIPIKIPLFFYLRYQYGSCIEQHCIQFQQQYYDINKISFQKKTHRSYLFIGTSQQWSSLFSTSIYFEIPDLFITTEISFQNKKSSSFRMRFGCRIVQFVYCSSNIVFSILFVRTSKQDDNTFDQTKTEETLKKHKKTRYKKNFFSFVQLTKMGVLPEKALEVIQKNDLCILSKKDQQKIIKTYSRYKWKCE